MRREFRSAPPLPGSWLEVGHPHIAYWRERPYGDEREELSIWVQLRLDEDWVTAYRLEAQDGRHVIAGVHLIPFGSCVPAGGATRAVLQELRTDDLLGAVRDFLEDFYDEGGEERLERHPPDFGIDFRRATDSSTNRRRRRDEDLARAGRAYSAVPWGEKRQAVADEMGCSLSNADKWIRRAKDLGFIDSR